MERIEHIDSKECKGQKTITIHLKGGNEPRLMLSPQDVVSFHEWRIALNDALNKSTLTIHSSRKIGRLLMPNGSGGPVAGTNVGSSSSTGTTPSAAAAV